MVLSDQGRAGSTHGFGQLSGSVVAADLFGTGESWFPLHYQMTLGVPGERPLGILVGQILDVAKWPARSGTVHLDATGAVVSFAALCAAAIEPKQFASLCVGEIEQLRTWRDLA